MPCDRIGCWAFSTFGEKSVPPEKSVAAAFERRVKAAHMRTDALLAAVACVTPSFLAAVLPCQSVASQSPGGVVFGIGCGAQVPVIEFDRPMRPGYASLLTVRNLPVGQQAILAVGASKDWYGVTPLPLSLGMFGLPNCEWLVAPDLLIQFSTGGGTYQQTVQPPIDSSLAGAEFHLQVYSEEPSLGLVLLSQGLTTRMAPVPTATSLVSQISQFGVTYFFQQPVQAGQFVNGDWFVVGPATIVDITPPCTTLNGRVLHGAMINPDPSTRQHGYDSYMYGGGAPQLYIPSLNVAANLSAGNPLVLQPNQALVKSISHTATQSILALSTCSVLTSVAEVPPQGSFRPPYAGDDHIPRFDLGMLDLDALQDVVPATGMPAFTTVMPSFERPWLDHSPGWESRYFHPRLNMPDYGRDLASTFNEAALMCNTNAPLADRQALAIRLVQIGIDFWGNKSNGCWWEGTGGHGSGRKFPILFAGRLLNDAAMLSTGQAFLSQRALSGSNTTHFGEDCQTFFVEQTSATQINWGHGGYSQADLGMPEYGFSHVSWPNNDRAIWTADSYRVCCTANAWIGAVLCARMMGLKQAWAHDALFDYTDRFAVTEPAGWTRSWSAWVGRMWDQHRSSF